MASDNSHIDDVCSNIDFTFICRLEGGSKKQGYVPDVPNSKSGVTIATGFDLGARNHHDLRKLGLNPVLIGKLYPYLGLQGTQAESFLKSHPISLSENETHAIDVAVKRDMVSKLVSRYNNASSIAFQTLPQHWQTVIASLEFQYGSVEKHCPEFWKCVTHHDWSSAIDELKDFGDPYPSRRNLEAKYAINNGFVDEQLS